MIFMQQCIFTAMTLFYEYCLAQFESLNSIIVHWVSMSAATIDTHFFTESLQESKCRELQRGAWKIIENACYKAKALLRCECTCYVIFIRYLSHSRASLYCDCMRLGSPTAVLWSCVSRCKRESNDNVGKRGSGRD